MNILVIGAGGREHTLAWKLAQSPLADKIFVAPGNAGTAIDAENVDISPSDFPRLIKFAKQNEVGLTVVGPEAPLVAGIVDAFLAEKLRIFGPTKAAAELEGSKAFCKNLLRQADVPTADYRVFRSADSAATFLKDREDVPIVVKADGLAAGKGVFVCSGRNEAIEAVETIRNELGQAGSQIVIEERLDGEEASIMAITDGRTIVTLESAQDHKRAFDGDTGPNTGGMGAYSPAPLVTPALMRNIEERVLVPTVHAMKRSRRPFRGVLYAGLMIGNQGPKVLEYNVRFGDPECQAMLMRLKSDLVELLLATAEGQLERVERPQWHSDPAICVVMASRGYPGAYERGKPIRGLDEAAKVPGVKVFHAGSVRSDGQVLTDGGRVLGVTAMGGTIPAAKLQAYTAVKAIRWDGAWCRKDISDKAVLNLDDEPVTDE
ncbi:MAG: phosphoribosylamine--glycine ligase [Pirellulales bacterium]|nr:phosphoribosylamine--glycine ligase [Pirellulales bacterium]